MRRRSSRATAAQRVLLADGTDVLAEADRCWSCARSAGSAHWRRTDRGRRDSRPEVTVRRRHAGDHLTGRCYMDEARRVVVTLPLAAGLPEATFLLLHELTHAALPARVRHGAAFREALAAAAVLRWPSLAQPMSAPPRTARGLDRLLLAELRARLGPGPAPPARA